MGTKQILVMNSKGGVGKSTLSSNLASYFSFKGSTALCDLDRQKSGIRWLQRRDPSRRKIDSITWEYTALDKYDWIVMDPPAAVTHKDLVSLVSRSDVVIVPVLPSPIDILAAADFIRDLMVHCKIRTLNKPLAVVANRARENTIIYRQLESFLQSLKLPFATTLRDSQNYIKASIQGIGIFEMDSKIVSRDIEQWQPLLRWINQALKDSRVPVVKQSFRKPVEIPRGEPRIAGAIHKLYRQKSAV
ncbi:MAG: ParA family protein [Arenicellales bacterium]|nr:ParA family protein [Arenicellales bacterium]